MQKILLKDCKYNFLNNYHIIMCNEKNLIEFFLLSIIIVQISLYVLPWWIVIFNLLKVG